MRIWIIALLFVAVFSVISAKSLVQHGKKDRKGNRSGKHRSAGENLRDEMRQRMKRKREKFNNRGGRVRGRGQSSETTDTSNAPSAEPQIVAPQFRLGRTANGYVVKQREGVNKGQGGFQWPVRAIPLTVVDYPSEGSIAPLLKLGRTYGGNYIVKELEGSQARGRNIGGIQWTMNDGSRLRQLERAGRSAGGIVATVDGRVVESSHVNEEFSDGGVATRGTYKVKPNVTMDDLLEKELKKAKKNKKKKGRGRGKGQGGQREWGRKRKGGKWKDFDDVDLDDDIFSRPFFSEDRRKITRIDDKKRGKGRADDDNDEDSYKYLFDRRDRRNRRRNRVKKGGNKAGKGKRSSDEDTSYAIYVPHFVTRDSWERRTRKGRRNQWWSRDW